MNGELLSALERIEREKGINKDILFEAIESALVSAARKVIDDADISKEDIMVIMDKETGEVTVYSEGEEVESERFGRIAAQTAKQVIIQKIREAERDVIYAKYISRVGSIINGAVHRFEKGSVIVELDDAEALLPRAGQIPRERFRQGEQIRAYIIDVTRGPSGAEILLSRTDEGFVKKLFELEVPEISQGIVEIKAIAREAGDRTKIAVCSKDEKVDPVGACVGMRGSRVRDIVKELSGERIDIIRWYDDIRDFLPSAVSPAEVSKMVIDRENKTIAITVQRDQLSLLIGKKGRNIRLASKLLGWELKAEAAREYVEILLAEVKGITQKALEKLLEEGYEDINKVLAAGTEALTDIEGIGQKTAEKIVSLCEEAYAGALEKKDREERARAEEIAAIEAERAGEGSSFTQGPEESAEQAEKNKKDAETEDAEDQTEQTEPAQDPEESVEQAEENKKDADAEDAEGQTEQAGPAQDPEESTEQAEENKKDAETGEDETADSDAGAAGDSGESDTSPDKE
jgi:transcription termination/antitermination protein NusA